MSKNIQKVKIIFENCDIINIEPKDIENIIIKDIKEQINRQAMNSIASYKYSDHIGFCLLSSANKEHLELGIKDYKTTVFERILRCNDLCGIEFEYSDGTSEEISVDWGKEEYINENQKSQLTDLGDLICIIDKNGKFEDYFDLEKLNDPSEMDFIHKGWYIN